MSGFQKDELHLQAKHVYEGMGFLCCKITQNNLTCLKQSEFGSHLNQDVTQQNSTHVKLNNLKFLSVSIYLMNVE